MSDINIYENQAAIDALTPISGDLVVDRGTSTLHLCTGTSPVSWKIFTPDENNSNTLQVQDLETEPIILASSPTNPSGQSTVKFGTDTYDMYVWDGSSWYIYNDDYTP